jgi:menaquinone-dependent protoporphyrinogen IX oxidase
MSLTDQFALANNADFKNKTRTATIIAANQISADGSQPSWSLIYANEVIRNPNGGWIDGMTFQVVANPAITEGSSDSDIQFTVNSNFEKVAKAFVGYVPPAAEVTPQ